MDFFGGPRDGDRIVVEGNPEEFKVPEEVRRGKKVVPVWAVYKFEDGAYRYWGQQDRED